MTSLTGENADEETDQNRGVKKAGAEATGSYGGVLSNEGGMSCRQREQ